LSSLDTSRIEAVLYAAADLAAGEGGIVGANHLCEAILANELVRELLAEAGVDAGKPEQKRTSPTRQTGSAPPREYSITPGARRTLELAGVEAKGMGDTHIGPEHLLLGILRAGEEASRGPAWFPYVGAVASQTEYQAVTSLVSARRAAVRLYAAITALPSRTLLRASNGVESDLLRPASGGCREDNLLLPVEADDHVEEKPS